jgi:hypothetical protein
MPYDAEPVLKKLDPDPKEECRFQAWDSGNTRSEIRWPV